MGVTITVVLSPGFPSLPGAPVAPGAPGAPGAPAGPGTGTGTGTATVDGVETTAAGGVTTTGRSHPAIVKEIAAAASASIEVEVFMGEPFFRVEFFSALHALRLGEIALSC